MLKNKKMTTEKFNVYFEIMRFVIAIIIAFTISFAIIACFNDNPVAAIRDLLVGPLTSVRRFSTVIEMAIPLTFAGLAVCVMFSANQFNLAAEGAFFLGGLVSAIVAIYMPGPPLMVTIAAIICAGLAGMIVCSIPGYLKIKWNCSEMVVSLMLNYVVLYFGTYIFNKVARDPDTAYKASYTFQEGVNLGNLIPRTRLHSGIFIVAVFVVITYIFIFKTKWGYKLRLTGSNISFARCSGIKIYAVIMASQLIGGFIAGTGGGVEIIGVYDRFQWSALPGYGFDGVILNIIARKNPAFIPVAAFFVSYLRIGADYMYRQSDVAAEIVAIIEGTVIILVVATAFLSKYKHKMTTKISKELEEGGAQ